MPAVRACTNCVRAKTRCALSGASGTCERCVRLRKACQPSPPMRKRRVVAKASAKDVQKLEEKLDGLYSILQGQTGLLNGPMQPAQEPLIPAPHTDETVSLPIPLTQDLSGTTCSPAAPSLEQPRATSYEPNDDDAELYLARFRSDFIGHLPFLDIPVSQSAHQMRQESPLLWLAIMTVASTRTTQQKAMSRQMRETFGREAFVEGSRSIDFLLSVLVYATWDRYYALDKPLFTSLMQLAIAIVYDLGLDKPPVQDPSLLLSYDLKGHNRPSHYSRLPTMQERRALLGCFLVSFTSNVSRNGEPLQWTPSFDDCLRVFEEEKESDNDTLLVQLVKLRLITGKVMDAPGTEPSDTQILRPSASIYLQSFQKQIRTFRSQIPLELTNNKILQMELYSAEMMIHEIGFSSDPTIFPRQSNQQFECLCACLQTIKSWTDNILALQPVEYVGLSCLMCANMARSFINLYRLTVCDYPVWDRKLVQETIDVSWVLETAAQRFTQVKDAAGLDPEGTQELDFFMIMAAKMEAMKMSWDTAVMPMMEDSWEPTLDDLDMFSSEFRNMWSW
ncbi:hypothetical protein CBS147343_163 [Aspergillus niger]|nr:hypothetical protein CBS12448_718 [Aspergillus niger]KAI2923641.1 hypothetical protein CBS147371_1483 [Aspergillus niger]KAI2934981.1 hypothetical protein CBS147320_715 [Aspergillus niger]KAI2953602.1 hypothetical protein CBS147321_446 [Aspergillus niger]KAI2977983.1 hypothetical protein CBS147324_1799 [Aspergillus niger]